MFRFIFVGLLTLSFTLWALYLGFFGECEAPGFMKVAKSYVDAGKVKKSPTPATGAAGTVVINQIKFRHIAKPPLLMHANHKGRVDIERYCSQSFAGSPLDAINSENTDTMIEEDCAEEEAELELELKEILNLIGQECLASFMSTPKRMPMKRSYLRSMDLLLSIVFRAMVVYLVRLEQPNAAPLGQFITSAQIIMPLISSIMPVLLVLDAGLFQGIRILCAMVYFLLGAVGFFLIVIRFMTASLNFISTVTFVNSMGDFVYGALLVLFKSKWPFIRQKY